MAAGPSFGDFSPEEPGPFGDEDEEEAAPEEQAHRSPPAPLRGEGEVPASGGGAEVEPPPERPAPPNMSAGQESDGESEALPPPILADEGDDESVSVPDLFGDLVEKGWGFFGAKRARK